MAKKSFGKLQVRDGSGTKSKPIMTGHGAGNPRGTRGKYLTRGVQVKGAVVNPHTRDSAAMSTLNKPYAYNGQNRFVQPTNAATAQIPPAGLGNPRGARST